MSRRALINAGVQNLRQFGYPACNQENILTNQIYKAFFVSMLEQNLGINDAADVEIEKLLSDLKTEEPAKQ